MQKLALIKLGGSIITFKDKPLSANTVAIDRVSEALASLDVPTIIVHGGGSFGHYWSVQYDMHTKPAAYDIHGISVVHESMIALNQIIVNSMIRHGLYPYALPPTSFTTGHKPIRSKMRTLYSMAKTGLLPVTFGDIVHYEASKYSILSGDSLMTLLAKVLRPSHVVFVTNVDGVLRDLRSKELVPLIASHKSRNSIEFAKGDAADVTGGMKRKITEAFKIARSGMDVMMVNGQFPERIIAASKGRPTIGTRISGRVKS
jgi:isopentenyl phosphate kinase